MTEVTITEALAELKLITSKVEKKKQFIMTYMGRQEGAKDPLAKDGGSGKAIHAELQAINDLSNNFIKLRSAIASVNASTTVEVCGVTRTVADWLTWRRSVAPMEQGFQQSLVNQISGLRNKARQSNFRTVTHESEAKDPTDVIIELDEKHLSQEIEKTQEMLDKLDGKLSLHNATTKIAA
jgi:hypothetical protein